VKILNNQKGVTLIETLIVLIILIACAGMFAMNRKDQIKVAYMQEARVTIQDIISRERSYFAQYDEYIEIGSATTEIPALGINTKKNTYFREFTIDVQTTGAYSGIDPLITVTINGVGKALGRKVEAEYRRTYEDIKMTES